MRKTSTSDIIQAVDSYGVIADIVMDGERDNVLSMKLKNRNGEEFGEFDSAVNSQNIYMNDGTVIPLF